MKKKVLFVCVHNSARSQIAEAYLNKFGNDKFVAESAGLTPGTLNPLVVAAMEEDTIDISHNTTKSVFDFFKEGRKYHYVISVCDARAAQQCPIFPGVIKNLHWSFPDPSSFSGSDEEKLAHIRDVRDQIKHTVIEWLKQSA